jgi:Transglycosylase
MTPGVVARASALLVGGALLGAAFAATIVLLVAASGGVLTTPPGAWVVQVSPLRGVAVELSVPGLARFVTSPLAQKLLDGRAFASRYGTLQFARHGAALQVVCAPCRFDNRQFAAQSLYIEHLQLRLARVDDQTLAGELAGGAIALQFTARLQPGRIDIDWRLPAAEIAELYQLFATVIPEAHRARIEGRVDARGSLRLPQRRARIELAIDGFAVDGLGTGKLAIGPLEFSCRAADGTPRPRRVVPGEGRWISPSQSGALLAAAVLAAEDQRFYDHGGYDRIEIAQVLARIDEQGITRGASTITQQLARTVFTGGERTAARKLRELLYAVEMERTLGKRAILALYLNTVDWGPDICGADDAARTYFGKRPQQLTPLEAAWLAAILPNPAQAYADEFLAGVADGARARHVLKQMRMLPKTLREHWTQQSLAFTAPASTRTLSARFAVALD